MTQNGITDDLTAAIAKAVRDALAPPKPWGEMTEDEQVAHCDRFYGPTVPDLDFARATQDDKLAYIEAHGVSGFKTAVAKWHEQVKAAK
jgi:hypothetical protein